MKLKRKTTAQLTEEKHRDKRDRHFALQTDSALMPAKDHALPNSLTRFINTKRLRFLSMCFKQIKQIYEGNSRKKIYPDLLGLSQKFFEIAL